MFVHNHIHSRSIKKRKKKILQTTQPTTQPRTEVNVSYALTGYANTEKRRSYRISVIVKTGGREGEKRVLSVVALPAMSFPLNDRHNKHRGLRSPLSLLISNPCFLSFLLSLFACLLAPQHHIATSTSPTPMTRNRARAKDWKET